MHVIIDTGLSPGLIGGIGQHGHYLYNTLRNMESSLDIKVSIRGSSPGLLSLPRYLARFLYLLSSNLWSNFCQPRDTNTIVHYINHYVPTRVAKRSRVVATIHDLSPWVVPDTFPPAYLKYIRRSLSACMVRADGIITTTATIKKEIVERFGLPPEKVFVCSTGLRPIFTMESFQGELRDDATFLFVGTLEKRKNIPTLLRAFWYVRQNIPEAKLVLVGRSGYGFPEIIKLINELNLTNSTSILQGVGDDVLVSQYRRATALILPSLYEGFGSPIIEALALGTPAILTDCEVFREVAQDAAFYYGDPNDVEALASAMLLIASDGELRTTLASKGRDRASSFSWQSVARKHVEAYRLILER